MSRASCFAACILAFSCTSAYAQEQQVSPREIEATWVGKTLAGTAASGAPVTMKLSADGAASISAGSTNDSGTWRLSENGYCTTWRTIRSGQERCFTARRSGPKVTVLNPDGSLSGTFDEIK
ncbi:MAG TPA: hypothetical protein PLW68_03060 [Casimicrobiaceae bacterium]|nr:hypothetical protein [Casimicrobiaceae bacterium]